MSRFSKGELAKGAACERVKQGGGVISHSCGPPSLVSPVQSTGDEVGTGTEGIIAAASGIHCGGTWPSQLHASSTSALSTRTQSASSSSEGVDALMLWAPRVSRRASSEAVFSVASFFVVECVAGVGGVFSLLPHISEVRLASIFSWTDCA